MIVRIYGASGSVGQIHSRIFSDLGVRVYYGDPSCLAVDAVSICTPDHVHLAQIMASLDKNESVFCEKPLFWHKGIRRSEIDYGLEMIGGHKNRRVFMNTSNTVFLDCIKHLHPSEEIKRFSFTFHTLGGCTGEDIAADLMPHGISMIQHLFGMRSVEGCIRTIGTNTYHCYFSYGDTWIEFHFKEDPKGKRKLAFTIDGVPYNRVQEGEGKTYRAYLEECNGKRHLIGDPFRIAIENFIKYCKFGRLFPGAKDGFYFAADNMKIMGRLLITDHHRRMAHFCRR